MAHTPGPWQAKHDYTKEGACTIIANVDGETFSDGTTSHSYDFICTCEDEFGEYTENAEANARLIAAAPELFEALAELRDWAQATGPHGTCGQPLGCITCGFVEMADAALAKARGEQ